MIAGSGLLEHTDSSFFFWCINPTHPEFLCTQDADIKSICMPGYARSIIALLVTKYSHNQNHISAHVSVKRPLTPLRKMIYESAGPLGPILPLHFPSCVNAYRIDTFRIFI